jgi:hypothetical protein
MKTTEERLRESEQSRRLAWQILQELRAVLDVLADEAIPREESTIESQSSFPPAMPARR